MRLLPRHASRPIVLVAVTGLFGALGAAPAFAVAPSVTPLAAAPSCVSTDIWTGTLTKTFRMTNNCGYTLRARMILARHADTDCITLSPGEWYQVTVARTAALSGVDSC